MTKITRQRSNYFGPIIFVLLIISFLLTFWIYCTIIDHDTFARCLLHMVLIWAVIEGWIAVAYVTYELVALFVRFILARKQFSLFCCFFIFCHCSSLSTVTKLQISIDECSFWISLILLGVSVIFRNSCTTGLALFDMFRDDKSMDDGGNGWYNTLFIHANLLHTLMVLLLSLVSSDSNDNFASIVSVCITFLVGPNIIGGIQINKNNYIEDIQKLKLCGLIVNNWNKYEESGNTTTRYI